MKKTLSIIGVAIIAMTFSIGTVATSEAKSKSRSYSSKRYSKPKPRRVYKKPAPKINLAKKKAVVRKPVVKKAAVQPVKNTTVVNRTTVVNNNNGSSGLVTGMIVGSMLTPTYAYHNQPYYDSYSNRTIDFTCIDGMKYRLTANGAIKKATSWFRHVECTPVEIEHYSQGRR